MGWRVRLYHRVGSFAIRPSFGKGQSFREGIAEVCDSNRCGYIDSHGNQVGLSEILPYIKSRFALRWVLRSNAF